MNKRTSIVNISGDEPETLIQLGKKLGKSKLRRKIFDIVYGRGQKPRSKRQIMAAGGIKESDAQQVQNELNYLATNHLIVRSKNDGLVKDGSAYLYERDETVRAHRRKIAQIADDKKVADHMITKRRPQIHGAVTVRSVTKADLKKKKALTVLYLTSNPSKSDPLRIDVEVARVQSEIRGSKFRDNVNIQYRPAANLKSLIDGLNDFAPQIVHFSGHGNAKGIATDNRKVAHAQAKLVPFELIAKALAAVDHPPRVAVLNSCESAGARNLVLKHVDALVAMRAPITDIAASVFAPYFYAAIASGQSVKSAFAQGQVAVEAASLGDADTPKLFCRKGVDAGKLKLS